MQRLGGSSPTAEFLSSEQSSPNLDHRIPIQRACQGQQAAQQILIDFFEVLYVPRHSGDDSFEEQMNTAAVCLGLW